LNGSIFVQFSLIADKHS